MGTPNKITQSIIYLLLLILYTSLSILFTYKYGNSKDGNEAAENAKATGKTLSRGVLVISWKTYIKSGKQHYTDKAVDVTVEIYKLSDKETEGLSSKNGKFKDNLELEARYLIYISKAGYETKMIAFSTYGVVKGQNHTLYFDVLLEKEGKAHYDLTSPLYYVTYNSKRNLFIYQKYRKRHAA